MTETTAQAELRGRLLQEVIAAVNRHKAATTFEALEEALAASVDALMQVVAEAQQETARSLAHLYDGNGPDGPPTYGYPHVKAGWREALGEDPFVLDWDEGGSR